MANVLIGAPIWSDVGVLYTPTFSGGSWSGGNPLTNLQNRRLWKVARSTNDDLTSTIVKWDLGATRTVRLLCVPKHNLSTAAKARTRHLLLDPTVETNAFNTWTDSAGTTPTVTTGQTDPFGGTRACLLEDNDAGADERKQLTVAFAGDSTVSVAWSSRISTGTSSYLRVQDATAVATIARIDVTWTAGVPSLAFGTGSGTLYGPVDLGGGWYQLRANVTGLNTANSNNVQLGISATAATTGSVFLYEFMAWSDNADPIAYDSGITDVWPAGWTAETAVNLNLPLLHVAPASVSARYGRLEIADTANADGYVDLARLCITGAYEPSVNFIGGAEFAHESETTTVYADGGNAIHDERALRRIARFTIAGLLDAEAIGQAIRTMRQLGPRGQCVLVLRPDATADLLPETSFLAVPRELTRLEYPFALHRNAAFAFTEEL